ncbi:hypothetical protein E4T47_00749 [Aureobasidium subglaciale]|nr:hypothetical protein E4T47_00749 [Aureobasidium subglaciale]
MEEQGDAPSNQMDVAYVIEDLIDKATDNAIAITEARVLLPAAEIHSRNERSESTFSSGSSTPTAELKEDEDSWYISSIADVIDMEVYSSGDYSGDINTSSEVDDDMDFYEGDSSQSAVVVGALQAPASSMADNKTRATQTSEANDPNTRNAVVARINAEKLNDLRAKLLASRQHTPVRDAANPVKNAMPVSVKIELLSRAQSPALPPNPASSKNKINKQAPQVKKNRPTAASMLSQSNSVDALLAEGHAKVQTQQKTAPIEQQHNTAESAPKTSMAVNIVSAKSAPSPAATPLQLNTVKQDNATIDKSSSTVKSPEVSTQQKNKPNSMTVDKNASPNPEQKSSKDKTVNLIDQSADTNKPAHALPTGPVQNTNLNLPTRSHKDNEAGDYFKDVDLWLKITGYHDTTFREQKLKTYKKRAALEEKKRILEREFAELERLEAAVANDPSTKDWMRGTSAAFMPPPPLPASASTDEQATLSIGTISASTQPVAAGAKRLRSPSALVNNDHREKLSRLNTSGRAVRRDDLFDRPLSAGASRRDSDQRSHYVSDRSDRPEYRQRAFDVSPTRHSIPVRGQTYRPAPADSPVSRREWNAPRSPEQWSARQNGWNSTSFSNVNEQPIGQGSHPSNKCGYTPSNPRSRYNR